MDRRKNLILGVVSSLISDDSMPNNEIWYTSANGNIVVPYDASVFGANIVSNNYKDGKGVITFNGNVTTIGYLAFWDCDSLTSVTIPDSVTTIGNSAIRECDSLTSVTIGKGVTTIGDYAFYKCPSLKSVTIPDSVTSIGYEAFEYCTILTTVTIGNGVKTIDNFAFDGCTSLTSVYCKATTPPSLDNKYVFASNGSGRRIYVPTNSVDAYKSATNWSEYAEDIVGYDFGDGGGEDGGDIEIDTTYAIYYTSSDGNIVEPFNLDALDANIVSNNYINGQGIISFDAPVTEIGYCAFKNCNSLTSITIPDSVTIIGDSAFWNCTSLPSIIIPDSVTSIRNSAFKCCENIKEFKGKFAADNGRCLIVNSALIAVAPADLTSYTIPTGVKTIADDAFYSCTKLTSVIIPNSVTSIGDSAFWNCTNLPSVIIPDSVIIIAKYAFYSCKSLTSVTIPDGVTSIGSWVFGYCNNLTTVTIGNGVKTINNYAFNNCSSLSSVYCKATTPPSLSGTYVFSKTTNLKIYVPTNSVIVYKATTNWSEYASYIVGYNF